MPNLIKFYCETKCYEAKLPTLFTGHQYLQDMEIDNQTSCGKTFCVIKVFRITKAYIENCTFVDILIFGSIRNN